MWNEGKIYNKNGSYDFFSYGKTYIYHVYVSYAEKSGRVEAGMLWGREVFLAELNVLKVMIMNRLNLLIENWFEEVKF